MRVRNAFRGGRRSLLGRVVATWPCRFAEKRFPGRGVATTVRSAGRPSKDGTACIVTWVGLQIVRRSALKHYECYNEPHYERNTHNEFRGLVITH